MFNICRSVSDGYSNILQKTPTDAVSTLEYVKLS